MPRKSIKDCMCVWQGREGDRTRAWRACRVCAGVVFLHYCVGTWKVVRDFGSFCWFEMEPGSERTAGRYRCPGFEI